MLNLGKAHDGKLSRSSVLERVSDVQLFKYYLGPGAVVGNTVKSPFRDDTHPSMSIYRSSLYNKIMWKDQTTGHFGDIFDVVAGLHHTDLYGALIKINTDFDLGFIVPKNYVTTTTVRFRNTAKRQSNSRTEIGIKAYPWTEGSLWYWERIGIGEELLKTFNVFPCRWVTLRGRQHWHWKPNNPVFAYLFHKDGEYTWKIYRPLASKTEGKWISNTNPSVLQGWDQLPSYGTRLIITKSLKDVMVLRTLGEFGLAMQQEISTIKPSVMEELKRRFNEILILQDFEYAGVIGAANVRRAYPFVKPFFIQTIESRRPYSPQRLGKSCGLKDIAEYREQHTLEETKHHLHKSIEAWQM